MLCHTILPLVLSLLWSRGSHAWGLAKTGKTGKTVQGQAGYIVGATNLTNCTCVDTALCNTADIITDGAGLINLRRSCVAGQVCCVHPTTASSLTGCGVG